MRLIYILLNCLLLVARGQDVIDKAGDNSNTSVSVSKSITSVTNSKGTVDLFETAHKIQGSEEFESAHKISGEETGTGDRLMQMQQTQNLLATKERPELNPVLSALINEDVMKSIESKRAIEKEQNLHFPATIESSPSPPEEKPTTLHNVILLTTEASPKKIETDDIANDGLIDQSIALDEAGSENNQKSRIQIKKGPNGVDYEYEYVYYYYDDDEKAEKEKITSAASNKVKPTPAATENKEPTQRGKSRYTNIERSTTSAPENEIPSRGKGRASIPVTEDVDEGRLPAVTRFPPRSKNNDATSTPSAEVESSEKIKKIGVKRPSLELVDSDSFNTDEKQVKGNRNLDTEASKPLGTGDALKNIESDVSNKVSETPASEANDSVSSVSTDSDDVENTTPLMEKVAFDLYAILANENLNMDMTTDSIEDATTDIPDTTGEDGLTTESDYAMESSPSTTTTTTTTTTSTTTEEPTTTTTTTTPAPLPGGRRGGLGSAGRNRFRLKSGSVSTTTSTEAAPSESTTKGRNRFQRPSFGGRNNRPAQPSTAAPAKEETISKDESKPVSSPSSSSTGTGRGRTRNRFNLRGSSTTTERNADENTVDGQVSSTTARTLRARPTLNLRGRGRPTPSTTTATLDSEINDTDDKEKEEIGKATSSLPTRPSRFNINRPGTGGANRLLPRGRVNLTKTTAAPAETESDDEEKKESEPKDSEAGEEATANESGEEKPAEATTQAVGGLNRLRNRPRIQIQPKTEKPKPQPVAINRKVNPLLARRKLGLGSSTTEAPAAEEEDEEKAENEETKDESVEIKDDIKDETTEAVEVSSEQPRGLALLGARRRLPLRKPGTIV